VAAQGFALWRTSSAQQRAAVLNGAARLMLERQEDLVRVATLEQGKTLAEARIEVLMNVGLFQFYAGEVQRLYGRALVRPTGMRSTVCHEPVGPVAAFAPWNFPLGNPGRKLGAPVAAGCSVILKAAEETPASALGVLQCLLDAGLPPQVAQAVFGVPDEVSRHLLGSPVIRKPSFTGSTQVGKHLAKLAADDMKRTTMELGGHGPVLVFADADLDRAIETAVAQVSQRRAGLRQPDPLHRGRTVRGLRRLAARAATIRVGNGLGEGVQMGPMANPRRPEPAERPTARAAGAAARGWTPG
jgi:succinate-semialdehyde dehydrogenase/glutarate-semialdehyde dehydrogenase